MRQASFALVWLLIFVTPVTNADRQILQNGQAITPAESTYSVLIRESDATPTSIVAKAARPGAQIINRNRRGFQLLTPEQVMTAGLTKTQVAALGEAWFVANFQHGIKNRKAFEEIDVFDDAQFWVAVIPQTTQVRDVIFQTDWFDDGSAAHAQLRFQLSGPILLIPQKWVNGELQLELDLENVRDLRAENNLNTRLSSQVASLIAGDIVYSLFGLPTEGGSNQWDLKAGLTGELVGARTFSSIDHMASMKAYRDHVTQHKLQLESASLKKQVFKTAIDRGHDFGYSQIYHISFASCITEVFAVLKAADLNVVTNVISPFRIEPYLKAINLIANEEQSLDKEYGLNTPRVKNSIAQKYPRTISSAAFDEIIRVITLQMISDNWQTADFDQLKQTLQQVIAKNPNLASSPLNLESLMAIVQSTNPPTPEMKLKLRNIMKQLVSLNDTALQAALAEFMLNTKVAR